MNAALDRYAKRNGNFVLAVHFSCGLQAYGVHEFVEVVNHSLIELVQLGAFLLLQLSVTGERLEQSSGERCVNPFEQFEENEADGVALPR